MTEQQDGHDHELPSWSEESATQLAFRLETELRAQPQTATTNIEGRLNYLIEWTQRQDEAWLKQVMVSLIINLVAGLIIWLSTEVLPRNISQNGSSKPNVQVREVRVLVERQSPSQDDYLQLKIVCRRAAPVKASWRRRAHRIAVLRAGSLVRVLVKRGKWVHVEWTDFPSGQPRDGWMQSKHLTTLKKRARTLRFAD